MLLMSKLPRHKAGRTAAAAVAAAALKRLQPEDPSRSRGPEWIRQGQGSAGEEGGIAKRKKRSATRGGGGGGERGERWRSYLSDDLGGKAVVRDGGGVSFVAREIVATLGGLEVRAHAGRGRSGRGHGGRCAGSAVAGHGARRQARRQAARGRGAMREAVGYGKKRSGAEQRTAAATAAAAVATQERGARCERGS
jgi:hypothetical protein